MSEIDDVRTIRDLVVKLTTDFGPERPLCTVTQDSLRDMLDELRAARLQIEALQARATLDVFARRVADLAQRFVEKHGKVLWDSEEGVRLGHAVHDLAAYRKEMGR